MNHITLLRKVRFYNTPPMVDLGVVKEMHVSFIRTILRSPCYHIGTELIWMFTIVSDRFNACKTTLSEFPIPSFRSDIGSSNSAIVFP